VLANTDLLSRQYQAGHGNANDVLSSLVALTFYKRFVLAPRYGKPLPVIDWSSDNSTVATAISQVQDEAVRDILNRELQARRALANSLADLKATNERLAAMRATAEEVGKSLQPQTLDLYAGAYEFYDGGEFTVNVTRTENKLYAAGPGQLQMELLALSTTHFVAPIGYDFYQLDFAPDAASGQTYRLVLTLYGMSVTGMRK
jgi:hypothetical protein